MNNKCNNCAKFLTCNRKECKKITFVEAEILERPKTIVKKDWEQQISELYTEAEKSFRVMANAMKKVETSIEEYLKRLNGNNQGIEDRLIIGYDQAKGKDHSCLLVSRKHREELTVINEFFNEEAEDIYYKLINVQAKMEYPKIREEAINRGMGKIQNIYSYKEILKVIEETTKLKQYTDKEREFILNHNTPRKMREILAAFWLTHTNDEFYHYFGFNWIPTMEIQEEARKAINKPLEQQINELANIPLLKATDFSNVITPKEVIKDIEKNITMSYAIDPKVFMRGATNESE